MDFVSVLNSIDAVIWGPPLIILLLGCHLYTTYKTKFIQRKLPLALKLSLTSDDKAEGDLSNFGAMVTSLASTLGTGSIVGVATAIMATKYVEVFASMKYRVKDVRGEMMGGAMHVWEQRFKREDGTVPWWAKFMAIWFSVFALFSIFGIGYAVQTSSITSVFQVNLGVEPWVVASIVCGSALIIIYGGIQRISSIDRRVRFDAQGRIRRRGGQRYYDGAAVRMRARSFLERGRSWHAAYHRRRSVFQEPGASGVGCYDQCVLVHRCHLPAYGVRYRQHHDRTSYLGYRHARDQRRIVGQRGVQHHSLCGYACFDAGNSYVRVLNHPWLELLRQSRGHVSVRPSPCVALPCALHLRGLFGW